MARNRLGNAGRAFRSAESRPVIVGIIQMVQLSFKGEFKGGKGGKGGREDEITTGLLDRGLLIDSI